MKTHGRDCSNCGTRFVPTSKHSKQTECSQECKTKLLKSRRQRNCKQCEKQFDAGHSQKWCSKECYAEWRRDKASRDCVCCGKTWYHARVSRVKAKRSTSRYYNCFCSTACSYRFLTWEANRKARCKCGKATGQQRAKCVDCQPTYKWDELGEWAKGIRRAFNRTPTDWERRIASAASELRNRNMRGPRLELWTRKRVTTWLQSIKKGLSLLKAIRVKERNRTAWTLKLETSVGNLRRRSLRVRN